MSRSHRLTIKYFDDRLLSSYWTVGSMIRSCCNSMLHLFNSDLPFYELIDITNDNWALIWRKFSRCLLLYHKSDLPWTSKSTKLGVGVGGEEWVSLVSWLGWAEKGAVGRNAPVAEPGFTKNLDSYSKASKLSYRIGNYIKSRPLVRTDGYHLKLRYLHPFSSQ